MTGLARVGVVVQEATVLALSGLEVLANGSTEDGVPMFLQGADVEAADLGAYMEPDPWLGLDTTPIETTGL